MLKIHIVAIKAGYDLGYVLMVKKLDALLLKNRILYFTEKYKTMPSEY